MCVNVCQGESKKQSVMVMVGDGWLGGHLHYKLPETQTNSEIRINHNFTQKGAIKFL